MWESWQRRSCEKVVEARVSDRVIATMLVFEDVLMLICRYATQSARKTNIWSKKEENGKVTFRLGKGEKN